MISATFWFSSSPFLLNTATTTTLDILDVIQVYGKLAGPTCYGRMAPPGSSCQITSKDLANIMKSSDSLSRQEFGERVSTADFQWPLKPYGVEKSNDKTALMNKGAETRIYMEELQAAGLYDPRNPTGPLPTSLRPKLNALIQNKPLSEDVLDRVYSVMTGGTGKITREDIDDLTKSGPLDYYSFLELIGTDRVTWR